LPFTWKEIEAMVFSVTRKPVIRGPWTGGLDGPRFPLVCQKRSRDIQDG
jgi:hypothetical protein